PLPAPMLIPPDYYQYSTRVKSSYSPAQGENVMFGKMILLKSGVNCAASTQISRVRLRIGSRIRLPCFLVVIWPSTREPTTVGTLGSAYGETVTLLFLTSGV